MNAGGRGEKAGVSAGLEKVPRWLFCFKKTQRAADTCPPQPGASGAKPEARDAGVFTWNSRDS